MAEPPGAALKDAGSAAANTARLVRQRVSATLGQAGISQASIVDQLERQIALQGIDRQILGDVVDGSTRRVPEIDRNGIIDAWVAPMTLTGALTQQICGEPASRCKVPASQRCGLRQLQAIPGRTGGAGGPVRSPLAATNWIPQDAAMPSTPPSATGSAAERRRRAGMVQAPARWRVHWRRSSGARRLARGRAHPSEHKAAATSSAELGSGTA